MHFHYASILKYFHVEEENLISKCLLSLFKNAAQYMGFREIPLVDDGSNDYIYEMHEQQYRNVAENAHIHGKVVRHTAKLGGTEAVKTGVNKAFGTLTAIVDPRTLWKKTSSKSSSRQLKKAARLKFHSVLV